MNYQDTPSMHFTTPQGELTWAFISEPTSNFNEDGMEYRCTLAVPTGTASPMITELEKVFEANLAYQKKLNPKAAARQDRPWEPETDDVGVETGRMLFKFKLPAQVTRKRDGKAFDFRPDVYDSEGKLLVGDAIPNIGGGSVVLVSSECRGYNAQGCGVKLGLKGVQIIELREFINTSDAQGHGFTPIDGGYVHETAFDTATSDDTSFDGASF